MPELAEVETVRRVMESALLGREIAQSHFEEDSIVLKKTPAQVYKQELEGATVTEVGRKGKYWWLRLENRLCLCGHLGMAGWIREVGQPTARLREHGKKPLDDDAGRPRFLKMSLTSMDGRTIVLTDGRRLARLWLCAEPHQSKPILELGPDVYNEPRSPEDLRKVLAGRVAPMKALLLDQKLFAGVGNWLADEILFQARISPKRKGKDVGVEELALLLAKLKEVLDFAISVKTEESLFPREWMFQARWGGKRGSDTIAGYQITREEVGGRTTAWVPELQK